MLDNEQRQRQTSRRWRSWHAGAVGQTARSRAGFEVGRWRRLDDVLAFLSSRDLLRIRLLPSQPQRLAFGLTHDAGRLLDESVYPSNRLSALYLQLCTTIHEFLPLHEDDDLADYLLAVEGRVDAFRREEQIPLEEDPLPHFFLSTFGERL